ncbi:MAG: hypothetical protein QM654_07285 [Dysgonamonadaceae bacterium]
MKETTNSIELRSEKVRNIVGKIPPLLLRYGILAITFSLVAIILILYLIPYQPSEKVQLHITQDKQGALRYTAAIPSKVTGLNNRCLKVKMSVEDNAYLPSTFTFQSIPDSIYIDQKGFAKRIIPLIPESKTKEAKVKVEKAICMQALILYPQTNILSYLIAERR